MPPPLLAPPAAPRHKRPHVHSHSPTSPFASPSGGADRTRDDGREKKRLKPSSTAPAFGNVPPRLAAAEPAVGTELKSEMRMKKKDKKKRKKDKDRERPRLSAAGTGPVQAHDLLAKAQTATVAGVAEEEKGMKPDTEKEVLSSSQQAALEKLLTVRAPVPASPQAKPPADTEREERRKKDAQQIRELNRQLQKQKQEAATQAEDLQKRVAELEEEIKKRVTDGEEHAQAQEKWKKTENELKEAVNCQVCFETFKDPHILACGHVACKDCLVGWFRTPGAYVHPLQEEPQEYGDLSYRTKQCLVCRTYITRRPARVYLIKDVLRPLGLATADLIPTDSQIQRETNETDDPWHHLFPPVKENEGYKYVDEDGLTRCPKCYGELEGPFCPPCDIEFSDVEGDDDDGWLTEEEERMLDDQEDEDEGVEIGEIDVDEDDSEPDSLAGSEVDSDGVRVWPTRRNRTQSARRRGAEGPRAALSDQYADAMAMVDRMLQEDFEEDEGYGSGEEGLLDLEAEDDEDDGSNADTGEPVALDQDRASRRAMFNNLLRRADRRAREASERRRARQQRGDLVDEDEDEGDSSDARFIDDGSVEDGTDSEAEVEDEGEEAGSVVEESGRDSPNPETLRARRVAHLDRASGAGAAGGVGRRARASGMAEESEEEAVPVQAEGRRAGRSGGGGGRRRRAVVDPDSE